MIPDQGDTVAVASSVLTQGLVQFPANITDRCFNHCQGKNEPPFPYIYLLSIS